ncbi:MAG: glycoside hydrolase family 140 protein [Anaerolineae bacterium]|jgi:hypothetical protein|nr:glycoside hydrolase family 140 protein [Anaerolineae bacterium]
MTTTSGQFPTTGRSGNPLGVSADGRYFVDTHGSPAFWLGDTQWELFRRFSPETALQILRDRQAKGFSVILVMLTGVDMAYIGPDLQAPYTNLHGEQPWIGGDPDTPNERYFEHVDSVIRLGEVTNQTLVVGVYHQWHRDIIPLGKARRWARWVARRYRDVTNLMWSMYPRAEESYIPVCRELAAGLQEGDEGRHLISVHPDPSVASSSFIHGEPWLAFNMIQTCVAYDRIPEAVGADYARVPVKPVVMAEGGYEGIEFGKLQTAREIRRQAFWTQLAGGHHVYGHNDAWTSPLAYEAWLQSPGAQDLRTFREIITGLHDWWTLIPAPDLVIADAGCDPHGAMAARAADGRWAIVYLSAPCTVTLAPAATAAFVPASAWWIRPTTGERSPAGEILTPAGMSYGVPEGWEDAVLLIEALA